MSRRAAGSGGLRQRNGRWQSRAIDPRNGQVRYHSWPTGTTAAEIGPLHTAWVAKVQASQVGPQGHTVATWLEHWRSSRDHVSLSTAAGDRDAAARIVERIGRLRLADVTPQVVDELLADLRRTYSPGTVRLTRSALSNALALAATYALIPSNPVAVVRARKTRAVPADEAAKVATTAEVRAMIEQETDPMWRAVWSTLAGTGCRPGELLALRWGDIDVAGRTVTIERTMTVVSSTGRRGVGATTKTGRARRVPIGAGEAAELGRWRALLASHDLSAAAADQFVFPSPRTAGPVSLATLGKRFGEAMARAGAPATRTPHGVRHWHASTLMAEGVPAQLVADRLGHSVAETMQRYGRHATDAGRDSVPDRLPDLRSLRGE